MNFTKNIAAPAEGSLTCMERIDGYALIIGDYKLSSAQIEALFVGKDEKALVKLYMEKTVNEVSTRLIPDKKEIVRSKLYMKLCFPCKVMNKIFDAVTRFVGG